MILNIKFYGCFELKKKKNSVTIFFERKIYLLIYCGENKRNE